MSINTFFIFRFLDHQTFVSKDNTLTIVLRRYLPTNSQSEIEYMDGAFIFHDGKFYISKTYKFRLFNLIYTNVLY